MGNAANHNLLFGNNIAKTLMVKTAWASEISHGRRNILTLLFGMIIIVFHPTLLPSRIGERIHNQEPIYQLS
jgi:hypothetical protein